MTHHEGNNGQDGLAIFGAMVLGAIFGAIAALLLAPKSGEELREDIGETAHTAKAKAEDVKDQVTGKYTELKDKVDSRMQEHKDKAAEAAEEFCDRIEGETEEV